jgi:hypothetical protein
VVHVTNLTTGSDNLSRAYGEIIPMMTAGMVACNQPDTRERVPTLAFGRHGFQRAPPE